MRTLRARDESLVAIAFSCYGQEEDIIQCLAAGFAVHLTKPADLDRLVDVIRGLMDC